MAMEKRDTGSGAKIMVPTEAEKSVRARKRKLDQDMEEVSQLKEELKELVQEQRERKKREGK